MLADEGVAMAMRSTVTRSTVAAAIVASCTLAGCGGSGSSGGTTDTAPETGTVSILFTDAPTNDFCHAMATVESIDLLGGGSPQNIWTGSETLDLLALRNYSDVFTVNTEVLVGSFSKVRLTLGGLTIEKCDDAGTVIETHDVRLPGNRKFDLVPRGSIQVVGGEALIIEIDVDMKYAVHLVEAGNSMRYEMRPVMFVTVRPDDSKLVRVFGEVRDLEPPGFELCPVEPVASTDDDDESDEDGENESADDDSGRCLDVVTDGATGIFDESGDPVGLDAFANGDLATAIGFLRTHDDDDDGDDYRDDLELAAVTVEKGPQDTFARPVGVVESAVGNNDRFAFLPDMDTSIDVLLQSGTRIFKLGSSDELTSAAIQPGVPGQVDGVYDTVDPATLKSALIVLDEIATEPDTAYVGATVKMIDLDDMDATTPRRLEVDWDTSTNLCVLADESTRIISVTDGPDAIEAMTIGVDDLVTEQTVDVYGTDDGMGCVVADTIQAYATTP
jgi:hypothetical protein